MLKNARFSPTVSVFRLQVPALHSEENSNGFTSTCHLTSGRWQARPTVADFIYVLICATVSVKGQKKCESLRESTWQLHNSANSTVGGCFMLLCDKHDKSPTCCTLIVPRATSTSACCELIVTHRKKAQLCWGGLKHYARAQNPVIKS